MQGSFKELSWFRDRSFLYPMRNLFSARKVCSTVQKPTLLWKNELLLPVFDSRGCREEEVTASIVQVSFHWTWTARRCERLHTVPRRAA